MTVGLTTIVAALSLITGAHKLEAAALQHARAVTHQLSVGDLLPWMPPLGHTFSLHNPIAAIVASGSSVFIAVQHTDIPSDDSLFVFEQASGSLQYRYSAALPHVRALTTSGDYLYAASNKNDNGYVSIITTQ